MRMLMKAGLAVVIAGFALLFADDGAQNGVSKLLFVYDNFDNVSKLHVDAFRDGFKNAGSPVDEASVDHKSSVELSSYNTLVLYSMVMAFDNISPVRAWLKKQKHLDGKRVFIFVTANRWFYNKHLKKLTAMVQKRGGEVVDGMTMATSKMSEDAKRDAVVKMVEKVQGGG